MVFWYVMSLKYDQDYDDQQGRVGFSGPLLSQSQTFDSKKDSQARKAGRRSRFYEGEITLAIFSFPSTGHI